jgi:voltage-gated potassium channel
VLPLVPVLLVVIGTLGYWLLEPQYSLFDALYMTVTTLTTVGYGETHPLHTQGRVFTIFLLLGGVITFIFTMTEILRGIVGGELHTLLGRRRMEQTLAAMKQHVIVVGYGRIGRSVCQELVRHETPFVLIERNEEIIRDFAMGHGVALPGDATSDDVLRKAGIDRARALITVAASDADNLYITMSARLLNEKLFIVARVEQPEAEQKLIRAGANRVVAPHTLSGLKMTQAVLQPAVVDFIELATRTEHLDLNIEETLIQPGSRLAGATLRAARLRQDIGVIIVAIKRADGHMLSNPSGDHTLQASDTLIAVGGMSQLDQLKKLAGGNA